MPADHSITSSAWASSDGGMSSPSVLNRAATSLFLRPCARRLPLKLHTEHQVQGTHGKAWANACNHQYSRRTA
jgi:hypothetical protein